MDVPTDKEKGSAEAEKPEVKEPQEDNPDATGTGSNAGDATGTGSNAPNADSKGGIFKRNCTDQSHTPCRHGSNVFGVYS